MVKELAAEFKLKSSNTHGGDQDWYIGFNGDTPVEEDKVSKKVTYLQHWDADNTGYVEEDEERDSGTYSYRLWKTLFQDL